MTLNLTLPGSLYKKAMEVADREHIFVQQVVYSALAEQLSALERLEERAGRSSEDRFRTALAKIPDVEPPEYDRFLPFRYAQRITGPGTIPITSRGRGNSARYMG